MNNTLKIKLKDIYIGDINFLDYLNISDTYYSLFKNALETRDFTRYNKQLLESKETFDASPNAIESTKFRAAVLGLKDKYGVTYDEAYQMTSGSVDHNHLDINSSITRVNSNYLEMLDSKRIWGGILDIDRRGRFSIIEGIHRLVINYVNGIDSADFFINFRHPEWIEFVNFFKEEGRSLYGNENLLYNEIDHAEFANFNVIREDRSKIILEIVLKNNYKSGFDLGCQIAPNAFYLARNGINMSVIEYEAKYVKALNKLCEVYGVNMQIIQKNLLEMEFNSNNRADFAIATSIIYHLIRNNYDSGVNFLNYLKDNFDSLFIDDEPNTGVLPSEKLISLMSGFHFEILMKGKDNRTLFHFKRD